MSAASVSLHSLAATGSTAILDVSVDLRTARHLSLDPGDNRVRGLRVDASEAGGLLATLGVAVD